MRARPRSSIRRRRPIPTPQAFSVLSARPDDREPMSKNLSRQLRFVKEPVVSRDGVVAAQNQQAADVGAGVLAAGGNAVDTAIATAFALAALEPWMSGVGGVGQMLVFDARARRVHAIDFGAVSARGLDAADYPLTGRVGADLFGWPEVLANRN